VCVCVSFNDAVKCKGNIALITGKSEYGAMVEG
jgi:hypothetical protein